MKYDCFISHEWRVHVETRELNVVLVAKGLKVWFDECTLGDDDALQIWKEFILSAVVVVLLT